MWIAGDYVPLEWDRIADNRFSLRFGERDVDLIGLPGSERRTVVRTRSLRCEHELDQRKENTELVRDAEHRRDREQHAQQRRESAESSSMSAGHLGPSACESPHSALCARAGPWGWAGAEDGYAVGLWPLRRSGILRRYGHSLESRASLSRWIGRSRW